METTATLRGRGLRGLFLAEIALMLWGCQTSVETAPYDLAITNVALVDARSARRDAQTLYLRDGLIARIAEARAPLRRSTTVLDGTGKVLIPGLWDMHVHLVYEPRLTENMADLFLSHGITSVRDTGGLLQPLLPVIERWRSGAIDAPSVYFSGPLLDGSTVVYDGDARPAIGIANGDVAQARENFAELTAAGVDFIKIYELVQPAVFRELVRLANAAELPIAAHVPLSMTADLAGHQVHSMEHLRNIELACSAEAERLLAERRTEIAAAVVDRRSGYELRSALHRAQRNRAFEAMNVRSARFQAVLAALVNTIQVPTLRLNTIGAYSPLDRADWNSALALLPAAVRSDWIAIARRFKGMNPEQSRVTAERNFALVQALVAAGVPIGAGTDTPIGQAIPGYSLHTELERMADAGLAPQTILAAATLRPAEFFGLEDRLGAIEVGMRADLLLLEADPLEDIRHTRLIHSVLLAGRVVRGHR